MNHTLTSDAFDRLQRAIQDSDSPTIIVELRSTISMLEKSLQHNMRQLQSLMPENELANTVLNGLDKNPFTTRINAREASSRILNPEDVVSYYKDIWGQPDWSADMVLESLANSNRSTIVSLQGYLKLIEATLPPDAERVYKTVKNDVQHIVNVHELIMRYLHT